MKWSYWFGPDDTDRRIKYAKQFKPEYQLNGDDVQRRITAVETAFRAETGIFLPEGYASGWRSSMVNDVTLNAAKHSMHLTAQAGDKRDTVDGDLAWWCLRNPHVLEIHGLYMEHPVATVVRAWYRAYEDNDREPTPWCHLQSVSPKSYNRVYWPDVKALSEWESLVKLGGYLGMDHLAWRELVLAKKTAILKE